MKNLLQILAFLAPMTCVHSAGLITNHVDIRFDYAPEGWNAFFQYGESVENPDVQADFGSKSLPARDFPTNASGDRLTQPASATFAFTGAATGAPLWTFPQTSRGYTWPGFDNAQSPGFLSYLNTDTRVNATARWWKVALQSVEYSGQSTTTPHFSLWQSGAFGAATIWMATSNGIDAQDCYFTTEGSHSHMSWGFTALGIYRVTFRASAFLSAGSQFVESGDHAVTFAIGTLATWRATYFSGLDLLDSNTGVPFADPDGDGLKNLIEYAFNMDPTIHGTPNLQSGTGTSGLPLIQVETIGSESRLTIEFVRRKASGNPQITYSPEFSSSLESGSWQTVGTSAVTSINTTWERVKVTDVAAPSPKRFARVRVTLMDSITY